MKDLIGLLRLLIWLAFFGALYQELKKPAEERTWHGKVAGAVPYDFRVPDLARIKQAYWDPDSDVLFTEKVVGVGWSVNFPVAIRKLSAIARQYSSQIRSRSSD
ncbi:MAG: hypothetical protein ABI888_00290 [Chloroflexota bacterium]